MAMLLVLTGAALSAPASAQAGCTFPTGKTGQCNEFGTIMSDTQRSVSGSPVEITVQVTIHNLYREQEVRAVMFSVRNVTGDGSESPVTVSVARFATAAGDIAVSRVETAGDNEINLWVDVLDVPVGEPIELTATVGSTQAGGFMFEALVIAFDRGYKPAHMSDGMEASLYSQTFLSVETPTGAGGVGGVFGEKSIGRKLPGFEAAAVGLAVAGAALLAGRQVAGGGSGRAGRAAPSLLRVFRRP